MDLVTIHKERQEQLNLATAYQVLRSSYEEQTKMLEEKKLQLIDYKSKAHYWEAQFKQSDKKKQDLLAEIEELKAQLAKREQQLFGRKSEKSRSNSEKNSGTSEAKKPRGQQQGSNGHGRKDYSHLPVVEETHDLPDNEKRCQCCGLLYESLGTTEDSTIVEIINVQGYSRKIRRKKYKRNCQCKEAPSFIDAPPAPRLIPKCRYGLSVWAYLLLQKYEYHQPLNRALNQLSASGISLASGTVTDGFQKLLPLLLSIYDAIVEHSLSEKHWHADETGWKVFEEIEGKKNNRWYMWLFRSKETIVYKICKSRSSEELIKHFGEDHPGGLLNVDRYSAYKVIAKSGLFLLAFCWAHVRRDFLSHAKSYSHQEAWALSWVELIAKLYHINNQRIQYKQNSKTFRQSQKQLEIAVNGMRERIDIELKDDKLLPSAKKLLKSLDTHWDGLTIFVDTPDVPMDNNKAENSIRHGVIGRNGYYGSGTVWASVLTAVMFTLFRTFSLWGIHLHTWVLAYFHECAANGGKPPDNIDKFLPWNMSEEQKIRFSETPIGENSFKT